MKNIQRIIIIVFLVTSTLLQKSTAQRKVSIIGNVSDADNHTPLISVSVRNISKESGTITDSSGKYQISAYDFDRIVFSYLGYFNDTVQVNALYKRQIINIELKKSKYSFEPVEIIGQRPNYARDSAERRQWFSGTLGQEKTRGWGAVEHPISALYDALSGRQKRIWRFQKDYKAYEQEKYVNSRVHPKQITELFHLEGDSLKAFLLWYQPGYYFVRKATDYELLEDIKGAIRQFRKVYIMKPNMDFENQNLR